MKFIACVVSRNEDIIRLVLDDWFEEGWYEIERKPDRLAGEYLSFDSDLKKIVIKKLEKTPEEIATEEKAAADALLFTPAIFADLKAKLDAALADIETLKTDVEAIKEKP